MTDLYERLRAAIEERKAMAEAAGRRGMNWSVASDHMGGEHVEHDGRHYAPVVYDEGYPTEEEKAHIVANDPARVIRHCVRDLKVLERHRPVQERTEYPAVCKACHEWGPGYDPCDYLEWPCPDAQDLAEAYGMEVA